MMARTGALALLCALALVVVVAHEREARARDAGSSSGDAVAAEVAPRVDGDGGESGRDREAAAVDAPHDARAGRFRARSEALPRSTTPPPPLLEKPEDILARFPPFTVLPREPALREGGMFPCSECHEGMDADPRPRELVEEHDAIALQHGAGRFWCLTCHDEKARDTLRTIDGKPVSYEQSFLLCGQCHAAALKDFVGGAHGKRVARFEGERVLTSCTACHDAHAPALAPRKPASIPTTRKVIHARPGSALLESTRAAHGAATPSSTDTAEGDARARERGHHVE